jgi:hypothetical protein
MSDWQQPRYHADSHLYDVGGAPQVDVPFVAQASYGPMSLNIHVHPSMGQSYPPGVMSNTDLIVLQRPNPTENVEISVRYMPVTGNILGR